MKKSPSLFNIKQQILNIKEKTLESREFKIQVILWSFVLLCLCLFWKREIDSTLYSYSHPLSKEFTKVQKAIAYPSVSICPQDTEVYLRGCCYYEKPSSKAYEKPKPLSLPEPYCFDLSLDSGIDSTFQNTDKTNFQDYFKSLEPCGVRVRHVAHASFYSSRCLDFNFESTSVPTSIFPPESDRLVIEFLSAPVESQHSATSYATYLYAHGTDPSQHPALPGCIRNDIETVGLVQKSVTQPINADKSEKYSVAGACTENSYIHHSYDNPQKPIFINPKTNQMTTQEDQPGYFPVVATMKRFILKFESFSVPHVEEVVEKDVFYLIGSLLWSVGMARLSHMILNFFSHSVAIPVLEEHDLLLASSTLPLVKSSISRNSRDEDAKIPPHNTSLYVDDFIPDISSDTLTHRNAEKKIADSV